MAFTHLQVQSHYSLLRGLASPHDLAEHAAREGLKTLALTDHNALYGAMAFDRACRHAGIRPIMGMTVETQLPPDLPPLAQATGQLVLLAMGREGYGSLCRLSARLHDGQQMVEQRPSGLSWADLKASTQGLLCLSGRADWLTGYLRQGQTQAASRYLGRLGGIFQENGYLAVSLNTDDDHAIARELVTLGERFGFPAVAVQPIACLEPDDAPLLRLLDAIRRNGRYTPTSDLPPADHWLTAADMAERFADFPDLLTRIDEIVDRCSEPCLPTGQTLWPSLNLPDEQTPAQKLIQDAHDGLQSRISQFAIDPEMRIAKYETRLKQELSTINQHGFAPLFLIVADITRFAREATIPYNTRGSVANSLAAYCLGITSVDPIVHDLLFERFLNPARANLPDIDLDFCSRRRDEVLDYVRLTYGEDRVALIGTMNTLQLRSAVRETAKAFGRDEAQIKQLSAQMPRGWHPDPRRRDTITEEEVIAGLTDPIEQEIVRLAYRLVGQPDHLSVHPGGTVITPGSLTDFVPVQWTPKGFWATQYDFRDVEAMGLPKIDLLGIRALTVIADTAVAIRAHHDHDFDPNAIPLDDELTARMIQSGDTIGVFQCESEGAQRTLRQLRARNVADLAVANAFFKPGPATGGMAKAFVRRYRGEEAVRFLHPALEPILAKTKGVLLFQEQVLRIGREIAGLSWEQADVLRRGMSKFKGREMAGLQMQFVLGCQRPLPDGMALTREQAETLWEQVIAFAGYGFNQGHATAYAGVSYRSAYLKAHFPAEFLTARLADHGGFHHPAIYIAEANRLNIPVHPPHVNVSGRRVTLFHEKIEDQPSILNPSIYLGLGQVRDLRRKSVKGIVQARKQRPFADLRDLLGRVRLQSKEITHLIQCGALDGLGESRAQLLVEAQEMVRAGNAYQMALFGETTAVAPETIADKLTWEKHLLGYPVSVHPLDLLPDEVFDGVLLRDLPDHLGQRVTVIGVRLPGWTGGKGFFLGDGDTFINVKMRGKKPKIPVWEPMQVNGRCLRDEWGGLWFQAESYQMVNYEG